MILSLVLPRMGEISRPGTVRRVMASTGDALRPGTPLMEVRVDLDEANARDCPAVIIYRLIATEHAYLRTLLVSPGEVIDGSASFGLATTTPEEALQARAVRALRTTSVSVMVDPLSD